MKDKNGTEITKNDLLYYDNEVYCALPSEISMHDSMIVVCKYSSLLGRDPSPDYDNYIRYTAYIVVMDAEIHKENESFNTEALNMAYSNEMEIITKDEYPELFI